MDSKDQIRTYYREWRNGLSHETWLEKSQKICNHLLECEPVRNSSELLGFAPSNREVGLIEFYKDMPSGIRVSLPVVEGNELQVYRVVDQQRLVRSLANDSPDEGFTRGSYDIIEPDPTESSEVDLRVLDLVLVPGLAFDKRGFRVGYGGGYYDGLLTSLSSNTKTTGVCFHHQLVDEPLPVEGHDRQVDYIVTEEGIQ